MEHNLDERSKYLESLENFISQSYERLKFVTDSLGWDLEQFEEEKEMVACPLNAEHRMPVHKLDSHLKCCKWKQEGYGDSDIPLPESTCASSSQTSVVIDRELQERILRGSSVNPPYAADINTRKNRPVPQTADRIMTDFTPGERLALYNYAVTNTQPQTVVKAEELNIMYKKNEEARPKSKLELLMEMRDAKRRRISYRSKKVHTNKKSHLEILREVINNQMEFLEDLNKPDIEEKEESYKFDIDQISYGEKSKILNDEDKDFDKTNSGKNFEDCQKPRKWSPRRRHSTIFLDQEACSSRSDAEERLMKRNDETFYDHTKLRHSKGSSYHKDRNKSESVAHSDRSRSRDFETWKRRRSKSPERERFKEDRLDSRNRVSREEKTERYSSHKEYPRYHEKSDRGTKRLGTGDVEPDGEPDRFSKKIKYIKESNNSVSSPRSDLESESHRVRNNGFRNKDEMSEESPKRSRRLKKSSKSHKHKKKKKKRYKSSPVDSREDEDSRLS